MSGYKPERDKKPEGYEPERAAIVKHVHGKGVCEVPVVGWGCVPRGAKRRPRTALISYAAERKIAEREGHE